ncbi:MAG: 3'(2'),5'-bisphosphate nucleotidase, partial [Caldithrix sp.]|nr:3'(2'),5'-bisphosphate nucleotidase [Caldithrix sp.]
IENGRVVLGVLGCPNLAYDDGGAGTLLYAVQGQGTFKKELHGTRQEAVTVAANTLNDEVRFLESVEAGHANHGLQGQIMQHLGTRAKAVRYDSQVKYAVLAQGKADVYLRLPNPSKPDYREKIWDHAAGWAIVSEAGGQSSDMNGEALDFGQGKTLVNNRGVVVTNGHLHEAIIRLIRDKRE